MKLPFHYFLPHWCTCQASSLNRRRSLFRALAKYSVMRTGYRWFGRGRGRGLGYGRGMGFGRGLGPNLSPYCRRFPGMPRGWWANPASSSQTVPPSTWDQPYRPSSLLPQYPQQNIPQYQYMQTAHETSYPQSFMQNISTHMSCAYFNNGICALRGMPVPADGPVCSSFTPRL